MFGKEFQTCNFYILDLILLYFFKASCHCFSAIKEIKMDTTTFKNRTMQIWERIFRNCGVLPGVNRHSAGYRVSNAWAGAGVSWFHNDKGPFFQSYHSEVLCVIQRLQERAVTRPGMVTQTQVAVLPPADLNGYKYTYTDAQVFSSCLTATWYRLLTCFVQLNSVVFTHLKSFRIDPWRICGLLSSKLTISSVSNSLHIFNLPLKEIP